MEKNNFKAWLYLLPAILFLGVFMVYPLIDVFIYSFEENFTSSSQTYTGVGTFNYSYVLHDPYFLQAVKNTFILVIITVPLSTLLRWTKLNKVASQPFSDGVFSPVCNQHSRRRSCIYDLIQAHSLL